VPVGPNGNGQKTAATRRQRLIGGGRGGFRPSWGDRVRSDEFPLTHEFLAPMLGVRRSGLSEVLWPAQEGGLLRYGRGRMTILDRGRLAAASCECSRPAKRSSAACWVDRPGPWENWPGVRTPTSTWGAA
jgi:hypothetical protein